MNEYHKCKSKVRRVKATYSYKGTNYHASMLRLGLRCKVYPEEDVVLLISPVRGAEEDTVENLRFRDAWCGHLTTSLSFT